MLRGEVRLTSLAPAVRDAFAVRGWDAHVEGDGPPRPHDLGLSSWQSAPAPPPPTASTRCPPPARRRPCVAGCTVTRASCPRWPPAPSRLHVVDLPANAFGLGLGAIGGDYAECRERVGELLAVAGCVAYFPSDGARLADYVVGDGTSAPRAVLASGITCEGGFSKLVRFNTQPEASAVPFSELLAVCLEAAGGKAAGLVIAAEAAGPVRRPPAPRRRPKRRSRSRCPASRLARVRARAHLRDDHRPHRGRRGPHARAIPSHRTCCRSRSPSALRALPRRGVLLSPPAPAHRRARCARRGGCSPTTSSAMSSTCSGTTAARAAWARALWFAASAGSPPSRRSADAAVNLVIGAATIGLILALLGLGVFLSYRVYHLVDLTADGSFGIGVAVAAALLVHGTPPLAATLAAMLAGALAGGITGFLHTRFMVNALLAGVLTSTALYSVCLFVMGSGSLSLASSPSLVTQAARAARAWACRRR